MDLPPKGVGRIWTAAAKRSGDAAFLRANQVSTLAKTAWQTLLGKL